MRQVDLWKSGAAARAVLGLQHASKRLTVKATKLARLGEMRLRFESVSEQRLPHSELGDLKVHFFAGLGDGGRERGDQRHR